MAEGRWRVDMSRESVGGLAVTADATAGHFEEGDPKAKASRLAVSRDIENWTEAFVTIDSTLHKKGDTLKCIYRSPALDNSKSRNEYDVLELNGKAVSISVPPGGFAMFM